MNFKFTALTWVLLPEEIIGLAIDHDASKFLNNPLKITTRSLSITHLQKGSTKGVYFIASKAVIFLVA